MNTNDLANRLKFLRAKANYTQSYVCSKIHLSRSSSPENSDEGQLFGYTLQRPSK